MKVVLCLLVFTAIGIAAIRADWMHHINRPHWTKSIHDNTPSTMDYWSQKAQTTLNEKLQHKINTNKAKNIILFLGDGMSIPTLKAARIYWGQMYNETGEDRQLAFEKFPYAGLSKTYCTDSQVPDSACTATAYLCGVKARISTLGVNDAVYFNDCDASAVTDNQVSSIARWSQLKHKRTGLVTTTRVTHASPAGVYAHSADRNWEADSDSTPVNCRDIAYQLIHNDTGKNLNVIMGGGRKKLLPNTYIDEEGREGSRKDGKNLIQDWLNYRTGQNAQYIWNKTQLLQLDNTTDYVLGLFESDDMTFHLLADEDEPTLEEMTEAAIKVLDNKNGYFLFVEGGKIDHGHHANMAKLALDETVEFSKAVQKARTMTNEEDTLIVVTSDHAHVMSVSGYPSIGNDILGAAGTGSDGYPYMTLSYANGPGYKPDANGHRYDLSNDDTHNNYYMFPTTEPLGAETHGGDEVGIFASGPWSHLFSGVIEQNVIPHIMAYAACVGNGRTVCDSTNHHLITNNN